MVDLPLTVVIFLSGQRGRIFPILKLRFHYNKFGAECISKPNFAPKNPKLYESVILRPGMIM